jgi:hypothetical protein
MRTNFSPLAEAARRHSAPPIPAKATPVSAPAKEERWCEWPRRMAAAAPRGGIWRALQEIQLRHA